MATLAIIARMKHYITKSGSTIIIGRNSRENELITFTLAKANDLWFHISNLPGPHVILISPDNNHNKTDIQYAANLAALYSSNKCKTKISVDYCKAIEVEKPAHVSRGTVHLNKYLSMNAYPFQQLF